MTEHTINKNSTPGQAADSQTPKLSYLFSQRELMIAAWACILTTMSFTAFFIMILTTML